MILSTKICVSRNIADYALGPALSNNQRNEILEKVKEACDKLEGDLAGKFYNLADLTCKNTLADLEKNHFLFG